MLVYMMAEELKMWWQHTDGRADWDNNGADWDRHNGRADRNWYDYRADGVDNSSRSGSNGLGGGHDGHAGGRRSLDLTIADLRDGLDAVLGHGGSDGGEESNGVTHLDEWWWCVVCWDGRSIRSNRRLNGY
jgi:hypothetical protein